MNLQFFNTPAELRKWFEKNHSSSGELWVGYYKRSTGKVSITWPESVEEALCFGWIDGIRKSVDESAYTIRFTPRRTDSTWSLKNINTAKRLIDEGRMRAPGLQAYKNRKDNKSGIYSFENAHLVFSKTFEQQLKNNAKAWTFFCSQAPYYRKTVTYWVMSAKQEKTRLKRLNELISDCENGLKIKLMR